MTLTNKELLEMMETWREFCEIDSRENGEGCKNCRCKLECDQAHFQLKQMLEENWVPISENINALPEPIRKYIHDIETNCDPSGMVRENTIMKDTILCLEKQIEELKREPTDEERKEMAFVIRQSIKSLENDLAYTLARGAKEDSVDIQALKKDIENYQKILSLILSPRLKVSREFVEERVNEMEQMFLNNGVDRRFRKEREWFIRKRILQEAGVEVSK